MGRLADQPFFLSQLFVKKKGVIPLKLCSIYHKRTLILRNPK